MDSLPIELLTKILLLLSTDEIDKLCNSNSVINKLCDTEYLWMQIAERNYNEYLSAFPNFTKENRWRDLVHYLYVCRIIPVYQSTLVGYLLIAPWNTIRQLYEALYTLSIFLADSDLPRLINGLPLLQLSDIYNYNYIYRTMDAGTIILWVDYIRIKLTSDRIRGGEDPVTGKVLVASLKSSKFFNPDKVIYPHSGHTFKFVADERTLSEVTVNELVHHVQKRTIYSPKLTHIPTISLDYNFFNTIELIFYK